MQQMIVWTATALSLVSGGAMAHPGDHAIGFGEGLLHPWRGLDHVLAMLAIGVWAAQQGGRALLLVPISIVLTMAFGAWLGTTGLPMMGAESGVAASVLVLLIMLGTKTSPLIGSLAAVFALLHGQAHGATLGGVGVWTHFAGLALSTAMLHGLGVLLMLALRNRGSWIPAAVTVGGLCFVAPSLV